MLFRSGVGEIGNAVASTGDDAGEPAGGRVEAARGEDAVAGGVLGEVKLGVACGCCPR